MLLTTPYKKPRLHRLKVNSENCRFTLRVQRGCSCNQFARNIQQVHRSTKGDRFPITQAGELSADIDKQINLNIRNARRRGKAI